MKNAAALAAPPGPVVLPLALASSLEVDVVFEDSEVRAGIVDRSPELAELMAELDPARRRRFVESAWTSGLRAALNAHRLADAARLDDLGRELVRTFGERLDAHRERQQADVARAFAEYFDPERGQVPARIDAFLRDDGELARTMARFLSADGELAKTLASSFGESSALMKRLSLTDREGVVQQVDEKLRAALESQRHAFAALLDPTQEGGALARFLIKLKQDLKAAGEDRDKQLAVLARTLDANDATSAMSRFFHESRQAQRALFEAMNPEDPKSALGAIQAGLTRQLEANAKSQLERLEAMDSRQHADSLAVRDALAKLEERRRIVARSAAAGPTFEEALLGTLAGLLRGSGVVLDATGTLVGARPHCKKGDAVARYGAESKHAGAAVVIEAKHDASTTVSRALQELEEGRSNRDASAGLFVLARSHAPAEFPRFQRYGRDILVIWDETDPTSDVVLECALQLALFMAPLGRRETAERADVDALTDLESRIGKEIARWDSVRKKAERMRKDGDELLEDARKGEKALSLMLKSAKRVLQALDVPLIDAGSSREPALLLAERVEPLADAAEE